METTFENSTPQPSPAADLAFVRRLMEDADFARYYFLEDKDFGEKCKTASNIVNRAYSQKIYVSTGFTGRKEYYIDKPYSNEGEIRAVLYMYFCQNPGKPPLATFKAEASFDTWFWGTKKGAAMRQVFRYYDSMGFVRPRRLSSGNTKLRILHLPLDKREYIVDLVAVPDFHEVLVKVYVEKKKLDVVREEMGYPVAEPGKQDEFKTLLSSAKTALREMIIETEDQDLINEALWTSIRPFKTRVEDLVIPEVADETSPRTQVFREAVKDLYGINHRHPLYLAHLENFVHKLAEDIKPKDWKGVNWERDADIWLARFLDDTPAKELAKQYGIRSTAVDNIKSRFEARIVSHLKKKMKSYLREA